MAARSQRLIFAFLLYSGLAVLLTWPLALHFTTHVPGDGIDDPALAWNLWWLKARLLEQRNLDIFHIDWMFHPIGINLAFYTLTPLNGLLSIPLQNALSLVIANNLVLLSSFVLSGIGMYLLARQELAPFAIRHSPFTIHHAQLAALFAGIVYAFASSKLFYAALGQFNIASSQWIPFCVLYVLRTTRSTTWRAATRNALFAALFLTLQAWAELTYASFLLLFIALAFLWSLAERPNGWGVGRLLAMRSVTFAWLGLLFLVGISPFLWAMIPDMRVEGDFFTSGGGFADTYSADLLGYLLPTQHHPLLGWLVDQFPFPHDKAQQITLGYSALLLAILGSVFLLRQARIRRWGLFWLTTTLFFWWLTLGAQARWNGQPLPLPGPFALISQLPFFSGNRYPSRYSVMLMLAIAILSAIGLCQLLARVSASRPHRQFLTAIIAITAIIVFLVEHLAIPMPLSNFRVPAIYERLAALPGDFTLLELPTGWRNGARVLGKSDILIMMEQWYQTTHGKRRLGGNTSRNPLYKFQYFTNAPLIGDLIALMNASPANPAEAAIAAAVDANFDTMVASDRTIAPAVLDFLDVRYVTLHVEKASPTLLRFIDEALPLTLVDSWQGVDWSGHSATIRLYAVIPPAPASTQTFDLVGPLGPLYLAEGWSTLPWQGVRYSTRPCATLLLDLPTGPGTLTLHVAQPVTAVSATLNGKTLAVIANATDTPAINLPILGGMATAPVDRLALCRETGLPSPALAVPPTDGGWPIGETGAASAVNLVVESAGLDVGNFARVLRNGEPLLTAQTGYNLVALNAAGALLGSATFNTLADADANGTLATWLQQWPDGTIIAGAVMDEASNALTEQAVTALATVGVAIDLRGHFRWSHAFIGAVGAAPGTAVEAASLLQPARVAVGVTVDAPLVYIGVNKVEYEEE